VALLPGVGGCKHRERCSFISLRSERFACPSLSYQLLFDSSKTAKGTRKIPGEDDIKEELDEGEERENDPVRQPLHTIMNTLIRVLPLRPHHKMHPTRRAQEMKVGRAARKELPAETFVLKL